ncbi:hypothetical protein [Paenibacillus aceris]|nr:hypothetical protein [Paenibacillus aceris]
MDKYTAKENFHASKDGTKIDYDKAGQGPSLILVGVKSLMENYLTSDVPIKEGLLRRGSYYVRGGLPSEALMRLVRGVPGYWYERV